MRARESQLEPRRPKLASECHRQSQLKPEGARESQRTSPGETKSKPERTRAIQRDGESPSKRVRARGSQRERESQKEPKRERLQSKEKV